MAAEIEAEWVRKLWHGFVEERLTNARTKPGSRKQMAHAAEFFRVLAVRSSKKPHTGSGLLFELDSRFLRKHLLASRFVIDQMSVTRFEEQRSRATEERRILAILDRSNEHSFCDLLRSYHRYLIEIGIATRTMRLYLQAAEAFCTHARVDGTTPFNSDEIVRYLRHSPGQAANLGRFITYCRREKNWDVRIIKHVTPPRSAKLARQVSALRNLLKELDCLHESALTTKTLARLFSLAFDIPAAQLLRQRKAMQFGIKEDSPIKITDNATVDSTDPLYGYARRWVYLAEKWLRNSGSVEDLAERNVVGFTENTESEIL